VEALLENVEYLISSRDFPARLSKEQNLMVSLPQLHRRFGCRVVAATLGEEGVLAWDGSKLHYSPAFDVTSVDTTGAGDIFHAGFAYSIIQGWDLAAALEFSNAAASLACMAPGARGGIASLEEVMSQMERGSRRKTAYSQSQLEVKGTAQ
jgi:sulfofructose kinase